uniref:Uncharacterized protein n=1 Tax=Anguilla anguilla TaxID=7936 RepID=A0A0E9XKQ0_ANGAN
MAEKFFSTVKRERGLQFSGEMEGVCVCCFQDIESSLFKAGISNSGPEWLQRLLTFLSASILFSP